MAIVKTGNPLLDKWIKETDTKVNHAVYRVEQVASVASDTADAVSTNGPGTGAPAPDVQSFTISENGYIIDGVLYSEVTVDYVAPQNISGFAGVFFVVKGYRGVPQLFKMGEDNYEGQGGGSQNFKVTLQRTGETITVFLVPKNINGATRPDWQNAKSATVTLDGQASPPAAPGAPTLAPVPLGIIVSWPENLENNLMSYKVYRSTNSNSATATNIATVAAARFGTASYTDRSAATGGVYFYWITAVNTAKQESPKSPVGSNAPKPVDPSTNDLANKGSIPTTFNGSMSYSSTTAEIDWSWNFTIYRTDLSLTAISRINGLATTGLSAGVTYYFYPYYSETDGQIHFVDGGVGSTGVAHAAPDRLLSQQQSRQDRIPLSTGPMAAATVSASAPPGTGGGGTGGGDGGCLRTGMLVREKTKGVIPVDFVEVGDYLWSENDMFLRVERVDKRPQNLWCGIRFNNDAYIEVTTTHPFTTIDGEMVRAEELTLTTGIPCPTGVAYPISIKLVKAHDFKIPITLEAAPHVFYASFDGKAWVLTHNFLMNLT